MWFIVELNTEGNETGVGLGWGENGGGEKYRDKGYSPRNQYHDAAK